MDRDKRDSPEMPVTSSPAAYAYYAPEDEIDLVDIWRILVKRKLIVFGVAAVVALGALFYALLATSVYQTKLIFLPPSGSDIQALNIAGLDSLQLSVSSSGTLISPKIATAFNVVSINDVYNLFQQNLKAYAPRQAIFDEMNLIEQLFPGKDRESNALEIFIRFSQSIAVKKEKKPDQRVTLSIEGPDSVLMAAITNQLAKKVERLTTVAFISDIRAKVKASIKDVKREMSLVRELQQKLKLANSDQENQKANAQNNDGPFSAQIREKEYELAWLESIQIDSGIVKSARVDQAAYAPDSPIKPNRKLIIVLGSILGLMLGLFSAFFVNFVANQKNKLVES